VPEYVVILQASLNGSPVYSTRDVIQADSCDEAEQKTIAVAD
jgi:hypothetical protein